MLEITIIGRGGQGAVTAGYILASAAFKEGYISQAFPTFGVERRGAPVKSFVRIDKKPITSYYEIKNPDVLLVLDPTLLDFAMQGGVKKKSWLIVNSKKKPEELGLGKKCKSQTIDISSIAHDIYKKPLYNVPIVAAFAGMTRMISISSIYQAIEETWTGKMAELNKKAAETAYNIGKGRTCEVRI